MDILNLYVITVIGDDGKPKRIGTSSHTVAGAEKNVRKCYSYFTHVEILMIGEECV